MTEHPITPSPELVRKWATWRNATDEESFWRRIATEAAQWGADQELEACCAELLGLDDYLRAARRPKLWSLKEQALEALHAIGTGANDIREQHQDFETIRAALEALND
jgi:hypothetical protein